MDGRRRRRRKIRVRDHQRSPSLGLPGSTRTRKPWEPFGVLINQSGLRTSFPAKSTCVFLVANLANRLLCNPHNIVAAPDAHCAEHLEGSGEGKQQKKGGVRKKKYKQASRELDWTTIQELEHQDSGQLHFPRDRLPSLLHTRNYGVVSQLEGGSATCAASDGWYDVSIF